MKRIVVFLFCVIVTVMSVFPCFAEESKGEKLAADFLKYYRYETEQITMAVKDRAADWKDYLGEDPEDIDFSLMYQVYYIKMKDIVSAYDVDGSFMANISDKYYWVVPNCSMRSEVQVVRNADTEYGWDIRRGTTYMKSIAVNYRDVVFSIASIYDNILAEKPDADKDSFRLIYDETNDMHIMYFSSEGEEYVVPYFASKDKSWLKNAGIYKASEYIELVRSNTSDETSQIQISDGKAKPETIYTNYLVISGAVVIAVALTTVIISKRKKKKS